LKLKALLEVVEYSLQVQNFPLGSVQGV